MSQYGRTFLFSCYVAAYRCAIIIQTHHLSVKFLNVSHCIRNFKEQFSTGSKKDPYWLGHLGAVYQRILEKILKTPSSSSRWERHFVHSRSQMVAEETKLFMRASSAIFQNVSPSGSRWDLHFGE